MPATPHNPSLRRHAPSKRAVVRLSGHDHYLGPWPDDQEEPSPEVQLAYHRLIAEWIAGGRKPLPTAEERKRQYLAGDEGRLRSQDRDATGGITVGELIVRFMVHANEYYRRTDGTATAEPDNFKYALRPLNYLYGKLPAARMRPKRLKRVRHLMVTGYDHPEYGPQDSLSRKHLNSHVARVVRMFRWAVEEELVPERVWLRLTTVRPLQRGRSEAKERPAVKPAAMDRVEAALPHLRPNARAMVQLQTLAGMRPGEVCRLTLGELDRTGDVWLYRPARHKTLHRERERVVALGPRAQEVLRDWIKVRCPLCGVEGRPPRIGCRGGALCGPCADRTDEAGTCGPWVRVEAQSPDLCLFSPRLDREERYEDLRTNRKSKVQPSQKNRKKARASRVPGDAYSTTNYGQAIKRACAKAGVEPWAPNQLRHTHGTLVRQRYGLEAAQVALGHARADVTQTYAERDLELARHVARELG